MHKYPKKAIFLPGEDQTEQVCELCGEKRIAYKRGSKAYFNKDTGARMPYPTACTPKLIMTDSKVISIATFVKANQIDSTDISVRQKFIEAIFILSSVQKFGLNERTQVMIDSFLEGLQQKQIDHGDARTG